MKKNMVIALLGLSITHLIDAMETDVTKSDHDAKTGDWALATTLREHSWHIASLACSNNGQYLVSTAENSDPIFVRESAGGKVVMKLAGHGPLGRTVATAFNHDDTIFAALSHDQVVEHEEKHLLRFWDGKGDTKWSWVCKEKPWSLAFSNDSKLLAVGMDDGLIRLYDPLGVNQPADMQAHQEPVTAVGMTSDGLEFASCSEGTVCFWDLVTRMKVHQLSGKSRWKSMAIHPLEKLVAAGSLDGAVRLFDYRTAREGQQWQGQTCSINAVAMSPTEPVIASGSAQGTINLRDWRMDKEMQTLCADAAYGTACPLVFSPDGKALASGEAMEVCLWRSKKTRAS